MSGSVLRVEGLTVSYTRRAARLQVVEDVGFHVNAGEAYGLVGESGCGKSTIALAIAQYLPPNGHIDAGEISLAGENMLGRAGGELRGRWRHTLGMVYQDPARALNPVLTVGDQMIDVLRYKQGMSRGDAQRALPEALSRVALFEPAKIARRYPHELSGGQQQRVIIAMALVGAPRLLILDEPTTNLDASVEAEVLDLLAALRVELDVALLMISHNLALVARMCERVGVVYAGRIVEEGPTRELFDDARHPYTAGLVRCVPHLGMRRQSAVLAPIPGSPPALGSTVGGCSFAPRCGLARDTCRVSRPPMVPVGSNRVSRCFFADEVRLLERPLPVLLTGGDLHDRLPGPTPASAKSEEPLLVVRNLQKNYGSVRACDDVSLVVGRGEIVGLVGETGSGKTTLARCIAGLVKYDGGQVELGGLQLKPDVGDRDSVTLRSLQMVFQNPDSTLNPTRTVRRILSRAVRKLGGGRSVTELAADVRLDARHLDATAGTLSGGLKQRVAIGRAFAGTPSLVICDEAVSSLDVSVQASILNLLDRLARDADVSYLFISHDLAVVHYLADRIAVMYLGQLIEIGAADDVFAPPQHPYTEALLSAIPDLGGTAKRRVRLTGAVPSLGDLPRGCRFHTRCPRKVGDVCELEDPPWREAGSGHLIRCHIPIEELAAAQNRVAAAPECE